MKKILVENVELLRLGYIAGNIGIGDSIISAGAFDYFSTGKGNVTASAEFNWFMDPEAAHSVLISLNKTITVVPLETCFDSSFSWVSCYSYFYVVSDTFNNLE